jgi:hypothetical protein
LLGCDQFGSFTLLRPNRALIVLNCHPRRLEGATPLTAGRKAKLITMTLAVTGLGTLVALSFVIHFPS